MSTPSGGWLFRYSAWDALLVLSGLAIVALHFWSLLAFHTLSWPVLIPLYVVIIWSYSWNLQCEFHYSIHTPYFRNAWLNRGFSFIESLAVGVPHILYHHYHLNHHGGDNDAKGADGSTRDWSSIYRHSRDDQPEPFWRYCLLSYFRLEVRQVLHAVYRHGRGQVAQLVVETLGLAAFWIFMLCWDWRYFLGFYLTSYYLGWVLMYAQGYLQHYGCQPGNPFANSASSYHGLYNLLFFNLGFHQEHHWDPKVHWTRMRELRAEIQEQMQANGTRILKGPHLTALIEDRWRKRKETVP